MNVLVFNASPKGKFSVTVQTSLFLQAKYKKDTFEFINAGQKFRKYGRDFTEVREAIEKADIIVFSYPVYTFIAPYQLHKFIEIMKAQGIDFSDKFATQITTSKHFYDVTAHKYIEENCNDMNFKFINGLSADMDDLLTENGQRQASEFWERVRFQVSENICEKPLAGPKQVYTKYDRQLTETIAKSSSKKVTIVTNCEKDDHDLQNMIEDFRTILPYESKVFNIVEHRIDGGCLGCFGCVSTAKCIYKDGFDEYLRTEIQAKSDAIVYAFTIKDHSMGASFKMYDDRQFCNGHRTVTVGMPIGYIINGNLDYEANLRFIIEGRADVGETPLSYVAYKGDEMKEEIVKLSKKLSYLLKAEIMPTRNFYGIGGMKIFRDLIFVMKGMMKADHKFYKSHGMYDFPQKQKSMIIKMKLVGALMDLPKADKIMKQNMNKGILMPYEKLMTTVKPEED
ncbi:MAG: NAD(P)H-dependent oxidoreductase [Clostridia bacterium]